MKFLLSLVHVFLLVLVCLTAAASVVLSIVTLSFWWLLSGTFATMFLAVAVSFISFVQAAPQPVRAVVREAVESGEAQRHLATLGAMETLLDSKEAQK